MSAGPEEPRETVNEREGERYSIHIRRKLLCCHQPFGGKHSKLVCVAVSGYNCLDMDIVSTDRGSEEWERKKVCCSGEWGVGVCEVWIQEIGMAFTHCLGKSSSTAKGENCL